ncbi:fibronectin type III domain protein [Aspergillus sclerotiicarbonarius CBS 121057]|uniref:Fibronectin type III domain protein n=1 Tax=Aspergillus sclerotiicarbonarius (strain CBS 121057 / IBT 28362) TaxID=1448318 RepID=A0A319F8E2_ASPSB|nr:fibronectin type III domain protein [Aspergillus sclerotiicarbonarius CBS 121057]
MYLRPWQGLAAIVTIGSCVLADHRAPRHVRGNASVQWDHLMMRDDTTEFDPTDLSFIQRMAAIGDSYSAGIGAGERLGTIVEALQAESVIADVINNQIPNINGNQQVILLSAGGNDVELSNILNQCIFQWAVLNSNQVTVAKAAALTDPKFTWAGSYDWDSLGLGCDGQLARTKSLIAGDAFSKSLDSVISAAKAKLGSNGMIYYTGYAKFWAEDLSSACDSVSWSTWIYASEKLTTANRKTMNELVDSVNAQISAAVDRAGSQVKFVDYDSYVGYFNGRFCEEGVDESTKESNTRTGLMFYELNTWDPLGRNPYKRSQDNPLNGTFEGSVNQLAQITLLMDPDAKLTDQTFVSDSAADTTTEALAESKIFLSAQSSDIEVPNLLPDGYGRVFHPQILLHELIAELVIYEMVNWNEQDNGYPAIPEQFTFDSCPYYPPTGSNATNGTNGTADGQQIALASYINPLADPAAWDRIIDYPQDKVTVLVANILNGPDTTVDEDWQKVINRAYSAGKRVLGYVRTGYLGVSQDHFQTRLGSTDLADWVAQIQGDVDLWYQLYPGMIGGIFFDEGWNDCGTDNQYSELYRFISDTTKRKHPGAFTVLNPGATMPQCFEHSADTLMTFENSYDTYMNNYVANPDWTPSDSRKLWHIIYNVPADSAGDVAALARERGAGLIHITDDNLPNPYDTLPDDTYMQTIMNAVDGGGPAIADPSAYPDNGQAASQPGSLSVTSSDYSSVSLSWDPSSDAPYAYAVYRDGKEVVRLTGTMSQVTVGNIDPGSSMSFTVRARGTDGTETSDSNSVSATTLTLPDNQAITNIKSISTDTSTTVQADILIPFAFIRVFLTDPDTRCSMPSWPINYNLGNFICTHYMVEGSALYQYSGANLTDGETNYAWTWTTLDSAPVTRAGYTYTWTLPIGSSSTDPNYFVVEAQGYNPLTNVFHPCPSTWADSTPSTGASCTGKAPYDCKGEPLCSTLNVKWCDKAVNQMNRGSTLYTSNAEALALSGNCWANWEQFGCSVQIRGTDQNGDNCQITGDEMWEAYQDIRDIGGCNKCGSKHFGNGCLVSVDYYYGCDNRDNGVNSIEE